MPNRRKKAAGATSSIRGKNPASNRPGTARMQMGRAHVAPAPKARPKGTAIGRAPAARPASAKPVNPIEAAGRAIGDAASGAVRGLQGIAGAVIPGARNAQTTNTISNAMRGAPAARKALKRR